MAKRKPTAAYRRALQRATPSFSDVARQMGMHRNTVSGYLNRTPPSDAAVRALVMWLRMHAEDLLVHAEKLEEVLK